MNFLPNSPLKDDYLESFPENWLQEVGNDRINLCSASVVHCVRENKVGARALRLYILGKAIGKYLYLKHIPNPRFYSIGWLKKILKPFFPKHFREAWVVAKDWGFIHVDEATNSCYFPSMMESNVWERSFELLQMKPEDAFRRNSLADIVWTTHSAISVKIQQIYKPDWSETEERASRAVAFMHSLNEREYFLTLETFGRLLGVSGRTMMRWSRRSGEFSQRRCVPVIGAPWCPEWKVENRPTHLKQIKKAMPNPRCPEFHILKRMLDQTREWGDNGHRTLYFFYHHEQKKQYTIAKKIPNNHRYRYPENRIKTNPIWESESWARCEVVDERTNKKVKYGRRRRPPNQKWPQPEDENRIWWRPVKLAEIKKETIKERRRAMYLGLPPDKKAKFREYVRRVQSGENMAMKVYDPILQDRYTDLSFGVDFVDKGTWMESQDNTEMNRVIKRREEKIREERAEESQEAMEQRRYEEQRARAFAPLSPEENAREDELMRRGGYGDNPESRDESDSPQRNFTMMETSSSRRSWKKSSLTGADGKVRFGINEFTVPICSVNRRMKSEWEQLMPERNRMVKWARIYRLAHRNIRPKKRSISCNACHQRIDHLPHPSYYTSCPHCKKVFAGVTGLVL